MKIDKFHTFVNESKFDKMALMVVYVHFLALHLETLGYILKAETASAKQ